MSNHWSALTDGRIKYVYLAWSGGEQARSRDLHACRRHVSSRGVVRGREQLFNLTRDPHETVDLAPLPAHAPTLAAWRARMVAQFETEGRGSDWVDGGKLIVRSTGTTYGPNFPKGEAT